MAAAMICTVDTVALLRLPRLMALPVLLGGTPLFSHKYRQARQNMTTPSTR